MSISEGTKTLLARVLIRTAAIALIIDPLAALYVYALTPLDSRQYTALFWNLLWVVAATYFLAGIAILLTLLPVVEVLNKFHAGESLSDDTLGNAEIRLIRFPYLNMGYVFIAFCLGGALIAWLRSRAGDISGQIALYIMASAFTTGGAAGLASFFYCKKPLRDARKTILPKGRGEEKPAMFIPIAFKLVGFFLVIITLILVFLSLFSSARARNMLQEQSRYVQARGASTFRAVIDAVGYDEALLLSLISKSNTGEKVYCITDENFSLKICPPQTVPSEILATLAALPESKIIVHGKTGWTWMWIRAANRRDRILSGWAPQDTEAKARRERTYYLKISAVALILSGALVALLALDISVPLRALSRSAVEIAKGNIQIDPIPPDDDETGILACSFNRMARTLISQLRSELDRSNRMVENVRGALKALVPVSQQLMTVTVEQVSASKEQSASVQQAASTSLEMAATSSQIARRAEDVSQIAEITADSSKRGRDFMSNVISGMQQIKEQVNSVSARIFELSEQSSQINAVIEIINEISEQTNMLALNASIEAAGAGGAGKRFTVVAGEVRRLAENTLDATRMVRERISNIQRLTNQVVMLSEDQIKKVENDFQLIEQMGHHFGTILTMVNDTSAAASEIKSSTQQQSQASEQMAATLSEISKVVARSENNAAEIETAMTELKKVIQELSGLISA